MNALLPFLIAVYALLLGGCATETAVDPDAARRIGVDIPQVSVDRPLSGVHWQLVELDGHRFVTGMSMTDPYLFFTADHSISGHGGCNPISGTYLVSGDSLRINRTPATRIACPQGLLLEDRLFIALDAVEMFSIDARGTLELIDSGPTVRARFVSGP